MDHGNSGQCWFEYYSAEETRPDHASYARAYILNAAQSPNCYVYQDSNFSATGKTDMPFLARYASNWSELVRLGTTWGMHFDFPKRHCFAFYVMGERWKAGYAWEVRGYVCGGLNNTPLTTAEVQGFIDSIHVRF